jgi:hypothetical protein
MWWVGNTYLVQIQHSPQIVASVANAFPLQRVPDHLDVPFQVEYAGADVVVHAVHPSLVVLADFKLEFGDLDPRALG